MSRFIECLLLSTITLVYSKDCLPWVTTPLGKVIGYCKTSYKGRQYQAYEGIPYAKPPIGDLRFEEPIPIAPWGTLNATIARSVCTQYIDRSPDENGQPVTEGRVRGQEDCLYLNIYVPVLKYPKKLPVIFYIHGGSFQYGSGEKGAQFLADKDLITVTINYRLGVQGFLSTEDEVLPGNLGLKDQSLALRWTFENIEYFNGNSKKIVLVGISAGSSSVQYHYLSPLSRGLFSSGIAMSGTVFNPWAFTTHAAEKAKKLGAIFNCPTEDSRMMIDCLKKAPAQSLTAATKEFQYFQYMPEAPFAPVIEKIGTRPFINKSPKEILETKQIYDVPAIFGTVSNEGCDPAAGYVPHDSILKQIEENWMNIAPHLLQYNYTLPQNLHQELAIEARKKYFGNKTINKETGSQLIKMMTDEQYFIGIEEGVRLHANASKSPIYFYFYSFRGFQSNSDRISHTTNNYGACHCDDLLHVIGNTAIDQTKTNEDFDMTTFLMGMWESIAYNGVPEVGVEWDPVDSLDPKLKYLHIYEPGNYSMSDNSNLGEKNFWKKYLLK